MSANSTAKIKSPAKGANLKTSSAAATNTETRSGKPIATKRERLEPNQPMWVERMQEELRFVKWYVNLDGKTKTKEDILRFINSLQKAIVEKRIRKIGDNDPYIVEIHELKKNLKSFITDKSIRTLKIESATLNGLEGILGFACQSLNGIDRRPSLMNSLDFVNLQFDTLGFSGKWLELIGDPSSNFTAMVFGKPKMGKSYLCVDFAGDYKRWKLSDANSFQHCGCGD